MAGGARLRLRDPRGARRVRGAPLPQVPAQEATPGAAVRWVRVISHLLLPPGPKAAPTRSGGEKSSPLFSGIRAGRGRWRWLELRLPLPPTLRQNPIFSEQDGAGAGGRVCARAEGIPSPAGGCTRSSAVPFFSSSPRLLLGAAGGGGALHLALGRPSPRAPPGARAAAGGKGGEAGVPSPPRPPPPPPVGGQPRALMEGDPG